jgi:hypothetical protein
MNIGLVVQPNGSARNDAEVEVQMTVNDLESLFDYGY